MTLATGLQAGTDLLLTPPPQLLPARLLMAFTLMAHIILVPLGVALPFITLVMNWIGIRRKDKVALTLARRWSTVMAIQFAVGVVSGTILTFEFGLLWPGLMGRWGDVFGTGFGIEAWAFFLEAILLSIYLYGWKRLRPWPHFLLGLPLPIVALVGAFGILSANAWMNSPRGFTLDATGDPTAVRVREVIFTPLLGPQYWHFILAAYMTAGFVVAGVYAAGWLRGRRDRYHKLGFAVPFTVAAIVTPVQIFMGDVIARAVFREQPVKFAAMELVWRTDTHVPEYIFGRLHPDGTVTGGIAIPSLDSMLAGFSPGTRVRGLTAVPANTRPTPELATLTHWAFDVMVILGSLLLGLALWYAVARLRRRDLPLSRWFFRCAVVAGAASVVAIEAGWITTEVGRQPWIVYGYMRVAQAVTTTVDPRVVWTTFFSVVVIYALIAWAFVALLLRLRLRWRRADEAAALGAAGGSGARVPAQATPSAGGPAGGGTGVSGGGPAGGVPDRPDEPGIEVPYGPRTPPPDRDREQDP